MLMTLSIFLAKVLGLYLVITCLAVLVNEKLLKKAIKAYAQDMPILFFHGIFALLLGLTLVVSHNIWTSDWRVIITIIGWLALLKGVLRLFVPGQAVKWGLKIYDKISPVVFIVFLVVGVYLAYVGFKA